MLTASNAQSTIEQYGNRFQRWIDFCQAEGDDCSIINDDMIERFIVWMWDHYPTTSGTEVGKHLTAIRTTLLKTTRTESEWNRSGFIKHLIEGYTR